MKHAGKMETIFRNTIAQDLQEYMKQITLPTLMIWGRYDDQTPITDAEIIHRHIKDSRLHILDGSHFIYQEKPQEVTDLIFDFLKR
jgi:pimeloyl-ACP methyl ester carboxylesterase